MNYMLLIKQVTTESALDYLEEIEISRIPAAIPYTENEKLALQFNDTQEIVRTKVFFVVNYAFNSRLEIC